MDFQQLLNLIKGNLGGQGMKRAEDGSMVNAGYYDAPKSAPPPSVDNILTNGMVKTGGLPPERAEIYPQGNETPMPMQTPPPDFKTLLMSLLGQ